MKYTATSLLLAVTIGFAGIAIAKDDKKQPPKNPKATPTPSGFYTSKGECEKKEGIGKCVERAGLWWHDK